MDEKRREEIALFRYEVIAPLLHVEPGAGALKRAIENLTDKSWTIPYSEKTRLGYGTIEHWMYRYKNSGLPGLKPSPRADNAQSRKITGEVADAVEEILKARPDLSGPLVLKELVARNLVRTGDLSLSSLWRFRKANGLDAARIPLRRDRRPFAFEFPGDCWQCDLMYGPALPTEEGLRRKAYLYAVIDDATRLICHAQFHFKQDLMALKDTLKQAFLKRGLPKRLYMDNAKIFQSKQLLVVGAQLGFQLLYTKPYRPEGRGKVERWFRTVRASFLPRLDLKRIESLDRLNRLLWAWIEGEYHLAVHRGLGEPPLDRWLRMADHIRPAPPDLDLERLFLTRVTRRVKKDGTFTLKRSLFEAGVDFIGEKIRVCFDPFDLRKVWIGREGEAEEIEAFPVDLDANRRVARKPDPKPPPRKDIRLLSLDRLADEMDALRPEEEEAESDENGGEKMARIANRLKSAFGLKRLPFTCDLDGEYFVHPAFEDGLKKLRYVADRRGIAALIAGAGVGKSTLIRSFMEGLGKTAFSVAYVPEATCAIVDLYRTIARGFDIEPKFRKADICAQIKERLLALSRTRKVCPVLILDEAHLLNRAFFDELRILANFDADSKDEMMLLLSGQPQLETSLRLSINEALAQRIVLRVRLGSLDRNQVENYVLHRLQQAGRTAPLFTDDGVEGLFRAGRGVPRLIDRVAEVSLLLALASKKKEIDADMVAEAVQEVEP